MAPETADQQVGLETATALATMIRTRQMSSRELLDHFLERTTQLNPTLNAVVTLDADRARAAAAAADEVTASGGQTGPLHGLPITVKDAIATAGMRTTGGAVELTDHVPEVDAPVVSKVRDAGAIVFGKSNLPRWSGDVQASNDIFGVTNNPWDIERGPGGSSGGAAAAVAAGLTSFEIGTDIGGSVRLPAHFSGVCGHKPSFGLISQRGYVSHETGGIVDADVNVFGPLARSVADLELLVDVMSGPEADQAHAWKLDLPPARHGELTDFRVAAWLDDPTCPVSAEVGDVLEAAVDALVDAGASVDRAARPGVDLAEMWNVGSPLISAATTPSRTAEEFERQIRAADDESADPITRIRAQSSALRHRDWLLLTETRELHRRRWADFFTRHDVLLAPVAMTAAFPHVHDGNMYTRRLTVDGVERPYADLIAWTGFIGYVYLPSTVVPVGFTASGLPVGMQVIAPYLEDRTALAFARHVESLLGGFVAPPMAYQA